MIELKAAVESAKAYARDVLGAAEPSLEEIERENYKGREVWRITLGVKEPGIRTFVPQFERQPKEYKSFLVDGETGEVLAMKIRELTA